MRPPAVRGKTGRTKKRPAAEAVQLNWPVDLDARWDGGKGTNTLDGNRGKASERMYEEMYMGPLSLKAVEDLQR